MKVREVREAPGGMGGGHPECRVRVLEKDEKPPADAVEVPEDTPEHDWQDGTE